MNIPELRLITLVRLTAYNQIQLAVKNVSGTSTEQLKEKSFQWMSFAAGVIALSDNLEESIREYCKEEGE